MATYGDMLDRMSRQLRHEYQSHTDSMKHNLILSVSVRREIAGLILGWSDFFLLFCNHKARDKAI